MSLRPLCHVALASLFLLGLGTVAVPRQVAAQGTCDTPVEMSGHGINGLGGPDDTVVMDRVVFGEVDFWRPPFGSAGAIELTSLNGNLELEVWDLQFEFPCEVNPCNGATNAANPVTRCDLVSSNDLRILVRNVSPLGSEVHYVLRATDSANAACVGTQPQVCVRFPLVTKIASVAGIEDPLLPGPPKVLRGEIGRLRVDVGLTFVEQAIVVVQYDGTPPKSTFNNAAGPVSTAYTTQQQQFSFILNPPEIDTRPPETEIGGIWSARLQVYENNILLTDLPFVTFVPS